MTDAIALTIGELKTCMSAKPVQLSHPDIRKVWLRGTSCYNKPREVREIVAETDSLILLKHRAHVQYSGRMLGSGNCCVYVVLYSKQTFVDPSRETYYRLLVGDSYIRKWEGQGNCALSKILTALDRDGIHMKRFSE